MYCYANECLEMFFSHAAFNPHKVVDVGHVAAIYSRTQRPSQLAWSEGRRPPGALTYIRQDEPGELSQWL